MISASGTSAISVAARISAAREPVLAPAAGLTAKRASRSLDAPARSCAGRRVGDQPHHRLPRRAAGAPRVARAARTTKKRASALTSNVSTNSTSPAANSAERCRPCASPNSLAITAARL